MLVYLTAMFNIEYIGYKKHYRVHYLMTIFSFFSLEKIICALRAGAEIANIPVSNCILIAGTQSGIDGAERIGMPRVVLRSR